MHKLVFIVALAALYGCGGARTAAGPLGEPMGDGNWFCESAPDGESWDCIQDPELARSPRPTRTVESQPEADAGGPSLVGEEPADAPPKDEIVGDLGALADGEPVNEAAFVQAAAQAPTPAAPEPEPARPPPPAAEPPDPAPTAAAATPQHSALLDLPADHYAVQLLAMTDARQLQQFVDQHGLASARTARVERSGELYYVLLLGVYDSLEGARQASLNLPAPLATNEPWIRPLGSLQNAIVRGNALAMATD